MHPMVICCNRAYRTLKDIQAAVRVGRWCLQRHDSYALCGNPEVRLSSHYGLGTEKGIGFRISLVTQQGVEFGTEQGGEYSGKLAIDFLLDYDASALFQVSFDFDIGESAWSVGQTLHHCQAQLGRPNMAPALLKLLGRLLGREIDSNTLPIPNNQMAIDMIAATAHYIYKQYHALQLVA